MENAQPNSGTNHTVRDRQSSSYDRMYPITGAHLGLGVNLKQKESFYCLYFCNRYRKAISRLYKGDETLNNVKRMLCTHRNLQFL